MSLREMPDHFVCDACQARQLLDALCGEASRGDWLACVRRCHCAVHDGWDDPGGVAIFAPRAGKLTWRGLAP